MRLALLVITADTSLCALTLRKLLLSTPTFNHVYPRIPSKVKQQ
jgi:hypothetical protein